MHIIGRALHKFILTIQSLTAGSFDVNVLEISEGSQPESEIYL